jgi:two-component system nitrate/nitrite response regulator NarL
VIKAETWLRLSHREWMVAYYASKGMKNHEIAGQMGTTEHVIKNYLRTIYDKLGLWNRVELAMWYVKHTYKKEDSE